MHLFGNDFLFCVGFVYRMAEYFVAMICRVESERHRDVSWGSTHTCLEGRSEISFISVVILRGFHAFPFTTSLILTCSFTASPVFTRGPFSIFPRELFNDYELELPLSIYSILSFPQGHPAAAYVFFFNPSTFLPIYYSRLLIRCRRR